MKVKAIAGARCPKEEHPKAYITDQEYVEVPDTAYYRRLVREGSLELAPKRTRKSGPPKKESMAATDD